jgi:hypothetical protein
MGESEFTGDEIVAFAMLGSVFTARHKTGCGRRDKHGGFTAALGSGGRATDNLERQRNVSRRAAVHAVQQRLTRDAAHGFAIY